MTPYMAAILFFVFLGFHIRKLYRVSAYTRELEGACYRTDPILYQDLCHKYGIKPFRMYGR